MCLVEAQERSPWPHQVESRVEPRLESADDYERICRLMEAAIAAAFAVPIDDLRAPSRRMQPVAFARQSAMYLAHVVLGLNYSATGLLFRRDRTTAAHACQVVEDRRDDPAIDRLLQRLESVCNELASGVRVEFEARP